VFAFTPKGAAARLAEQWITVLPELDRTPVMRAVTTADTLYLVTEKRLFRVAGGAFAEPFGPDLNDPVYTGAAFRTAAFRNGGGIYAAGTKGFTDPNDAQPSFKRPDGPLSNLVHSLTVDEQGRVWSATGPTAGSSGVNVFDGVAWRTYSRERGGLPTDAVSCVATGRDGSMFLGTWGNGILHLFADDSLRVYSPSSVIGFPGATVDSSYAVISGLAVDSRGTLWATHYQGSKGTILSSRSADGVWRFHRNPWWDNAYVSGLTIDQLGNKWMWFAFDYTGAALFNEKGTPDDPSDDVWQRIDRGNFIEGAVKCASADRFGDVWVGTSVGPRTVFNPATPDRVSRTCYNTRCNIEGVPVNCIAIDAVNNKWLGTSEGVFVLSPDGGTIIAHYTAENSPLIDNMITSITVHPQTGEAFIGTVRGLSSVTTPYIEPAPAVELRVSPNPFKAGIDDRIMIEGLPEGSALKILTIAGDLVAELDTPGGGLGFWDGRRADGTPAASGVYIIVAFQTEGGEIRIGKLALVRP